MATRTRLVMVEEDEATESLAVDDQPAETAAPDPAGPAATDPVPDPAPVAQVGTGERFHALLALEGVETGDNRIFVPGSLTWRDLPLPLMATDESDHGALVVNPTVLIGNFDTIERRGNEVHGFGAYISEPDEQAAGLIRTVQRRELRGCSVDVDAVAAEILVPVDKDPGDGTIEDETDIVGDPADQYPRETDDEGQDWIVIGGPEPKLRVTEGRIMGATVVPFPAFQEAFIEPDDGEGTAALAASAAAVFARYDVTGALLADGEPAAPARFSFPELPPEAWFEMPESDGPCPLTFTDDGQVYGHLAVWGECHVGIAGDCVEPPASASNYARFHVGEIPTVEGGRVAVGRLTFSTGHADSRLNAEATRAHYDTTGTVAADVVASDGEYGIWLCGAARPALSLSQVREVMASPPSGDWRRFGKTLELVGALCVNVPGFNVPRAAYRKLDGMVASLIVSHPADPLEPAVPRDPLLSAVVDRIAASVGRSKSDRIAALAARVHG